MQGPWKWVMSSLEEGGLWPGLKLTQSRSSVVDLEAITVSQPDLHHGANDVHCPGFFGGRTGQNILNKLNPCKPYSERTPYFLPLVCTVTQPPVVVAGIFSSKPASTICPCCRQIITTETVYRVGSLTYAASMAMCMIGWAFYIYFFCSDDGWIQWTGQSPFHETSKRGKGPQMGTHKLWALWHSIKTPFSSWALGRAAPEEDMDPSVRSEY